MKGQCAHSVNVSFSFLLKDLPKVTPLGSSKAEPGAPGALTSATPQLSLCPEPELH